MGILKNTMYLRNVSFYERRRCVILTNLYRGNKMNIDPKNKKLVSVLAGIAAIIILIAIWDK